MKRGRSEAGFAAPADLAVAQVSSLAGACASPRTDIALIAETGGVIVGRVLGADAASYPDVFVVGYRRGYSAYSLSSSESCSRDVVRTILPTCSATAFAPYTTATAPVSSAGSRRVTRGRNSRVVPIGGRK